MFQILPELLLLLLCQPSSYFILRSSSLKFKFSMTTERTSKFQFNPIDVLNFSVIPTFENDF